MSEIVDFIPRGVCSKRMIVEIENNKIVNAEFIGGCNGNLKGIRSLVIGMEVEEVIKRLKGILCGSKQTSCPNEFALCLEEYLQKSKDKNKIEV